VAVFPIYWMHRLASCVYWRILAYPLYHPLCPPHSLPTHPLWAALMILQAMLKIHSNPSKSSYQPLLSDKANYWATLAQYKSYTATINYSIARIFQISISQNPIIDNLIGFPKSGHICTYVATYVHKKS